jgi:ABC-2 type transport system ATP-binding protein
MASSRSRSASTGPSTASGAADLELIDVSRGWGRRRRREVLRSVSLRAPAGTVSWVGGANGAGKTTLLRVTAGILTPDGGEVGLGSLDPERDRERYQSEVGLVSAGDRGLYARVTVRRQLDMQARLAFIPKPDRRERVGAAIRSFGLTELADARTDQLSLGQRQRVRLALSLLHAPRLVLLDEPASSLDEAGLEVLVAAVGAIVERGGIVLWCSPPHERAVIGSDAEYVLEHGCLEPA